jgi:uncharacterized membrane protein HdeD (DUF308 family)
MKDKDVYDEISSIKNIMERSTRFISLSGLSGVMAGVYALVGAGLVYLSAPEYLKQYLNPYSHYTVQDVNFSGGYVVFVAESTLIAMAVLLLSIVTGIFLTVNKAKRKGQGVWNESSRSLLKKGLLPLLTGSCFVVIALLSNQNELIVPGCLIFYGLSLASASQYTYGDVKWLGIIDIILGLLALIFPYYGFIIWALGFGVLHILYGTFMYFKYERENSAD